MDDTARTLEDPKAEPGARARLSAQTDSEVAAPLQGGTSEKRAAANRQNARRSTGPRTAAGKRAVRLNALKHGLLAAEVIIRTGDGAENETVFRRLVDQLRQQLDPQGIREELAVEEIAVLLWRQRRAVRAETGEIRRGADTVTWEMREHRRKELGASVRRLRTRNAHLLGMDQDAVSLQQDALGVQYLLDVLAEAREEVEITGSLSRDTVDRLRAHFPEEATETFALICALLADSPLDQEPETPAMTDGAENATTRDAPEADGPIAEARKAALLKWLTGKLRQLRKRKAVLERAHRLEEEAARACRSLPAADTTDHLLRYSTAISRQLDKAWRRLDHLQSARRTQATTAGRPRDGR
jgi:hypothetical protein